MIPFLKQVLVVEPKIIRWIYNDTFDTSFKENGHQEKNVGNFEHGSNILVYFF